jgi:primosomal protein N' (replication factor Y)
MERVTLFADVILPLSLGRLYTYRIPDEWKDEAIPGKRVIVPFGSKKFYAAVIYQIKEQPPAGYEAKYIHHILDDVPILSEADFRFWEWLARYYMGHLGDVMAMALPAALRLQSESLLVLHPDAQWNDNDLSPEELRILQLLREKSYLSMEGLPEIVGQKSAHRFVKSLYERGLILIKEDISERYAPKMQKMLQLSPQWSDEVFANETLQRAEKKAPKQCDILMGLLMAGKAVERSAWMKQYGFSDSALKQLLDKGWVIQTEEAISRVQQHSSETEPEHMEQLAVFTAQLEEQWLTKGVALLHGDRGSGKTALYAAMARKLVAEGKQVLILQPEIAITEALIQHFGDLFGEDLVVWHSKFSQAERYEIWEQVRSGKPCVVLGSRSAIFLPMEKPGLIVVDEEHESSYKFFDRRLHLHARDAALMLGRQRGIPVLLVSSTPSSEAWFLASIGTYGILELPPVNKPKTLLIDTGYLKRSHNMKGQFSEQLLSLIQQCLDRNGQVLVYHNRKGFVPWIRCESCGWLPRCIQCDVTLTYYKAGNRQLCHYCGSSSAPVNHCPACGSHKLSMQGYGTERVADELALIFPQARVQRLDPETAKSRREMEAIIQAFRQGQTDILVGTQLLSKGIDIGRMGLALITDAELTVNLPDFRAHERALQQFVQVLSQARPELEGGQAVIQTLNPALPLFTQIANRDLRSFYAQELPLRERFHFPPYTRLVRITFRHKEFEWAEKAAIAFVERLPAHGEWIVNPPAKPYVPRVRNMYLMQVLVRIDRNSRLLSEFKERMRNVLHELLGDKCFKGLQTDVDVDPL